MSNDLTPPFDLSNAPKHIQQTELSKSLATTQSISIPRIVFNGKGSWEMKLGSELQKSIESKDLNVIIVGVAPKVSRAFYEDAYTPGFAKPPVCWSNDSEKPNSVIENPQALTCNSCPKNIKGAGGKPCRYHRRIAVVRAEKIDGEIYQMQLPSTSIFPKTNGNKMAFNGYLKYLDVTGTSIDRVITRMYFDEEVSWGKLFFTPIRFVDEGDVATLKELTNAAEVQEAITTSYSLINNNEESKTAFVEPNATESNETPFEPVSIFEANVEPVEKPKVKTRKKKEVAAQEENSDMNSILKEFAERDEEVDDE